MILKESGLQTHAMLLKEKAILANLPALMARITHNMSKFNSLILSATNSLKRNESSAPDLLHQLFQAYLPCPNNKFHDYFTLKQNKFDEGAVMNTYYLIKCAKYKYKTLLDKGEWEAPIAQEEQIIALRAEINTLKARSSKGGAGKCQHQCHDKPLTIKQTQKKVKGKVKRYFSWQLIPPKVSQVNTRAKWEKEYHWCSTKTGAPSQGCNRWVVHKPSEYLGLTKGAATHNKKPNEMKVKRKHALHAKAITVPLKKAKLAETINLDDDNWGDDSDRNQDYDSSWYGQFVKHVMSILLNIELRVKINFNFKYIVKPTHTVINTYSYRLQIIFAPNYNILSRFLKTKYANITSTGGAVKTLSQTELSN